MVIEVPVSDLSRAFVSDPSKAWPDEIRIVAQWTLSSGKRKSKAVILSKEEYFGIGRHGAPMNGDQLMQKIEALRKERP
jgi:hypothetical protein